MSDEVAPFAPEPLTLDQAQENLTSAVNAYNTAVNAAAGLPASVVAHFVVAIDERAYTVDGMVCSPPSVLEPVGQPEWITRALLREAAGMGVFVEVDYDPEDED